MSDETYGVGAEYDKLTMLETRLGFIERAMGLEFVPPHEVPATYKRIQPEAKPEEDATSDDE